MRQVCGLEAGLPASSSRGFFSDVFRIRFSRSESREEVARMGEAPGEPLTLVRNCGEVPCLESLHPPSASVAGALFTRRTTTSWSMRFPRRGLEGGGGTTLPRRLCFVSLTHTLASDGPGQGGISESSCTWAGLPVFSPRLPFASAVGVPVGLTGRAPGSALLVRLFGGGLPGQGRPTGLTSAPVSAR